MEGTIPQQIFRDLAGNPRYWVEYSDALWESGFLLWECGERSIKSGQVMHGVNRFNHAAMLFGMALENMVKAAKVANGCPVIKEKGNGFFLDDELKHHRVLLEMEKLGVSLGRVSIDAPEETLVDESEVVRHLENLVTWRGKYPTPTKCMTEDLKYDDLTPVSVPAQIIRISSQAGFRDAIYQIIQRVAEKVPGAGNGRGGI